MWSHYEDMQEETALRAYIQNFNNATDVIYTHSTIHREALVGKRTAPELKSITRSSNCSGLHKETGDNSRLFSKLGKAMGSNLDQLLLLVGVGCL
jgi:hypothetical protein